MGAQMEYGCVDGKEEEKKDYIHRLRDDLANTYWWSGNWFQDFFFFVCQWHPLIGILMCHPNHPWSKRDRIQMTVISLCLTMIPAVWVGQRYEGQKDSNPLAKFERTTETIFLITIPDIIYGVLLYQLSIADSRCPSCAAFWNGLHLCCMNCILVIAGIA